MWYNNLKPAACAAARTSCADALLRMGFENIEPCKISADEIFVKAAPCGGPAGGQS